MPPRRRYDEDEVRTAVAAALAGDLSQLRLAVRGLAEQLALSVPGHTVEVRVPPHAAVQCVEGPRHTRGTPPNVVECDPLAFVQLCTGRLAWTEAVADGRVRASGERADLRALLPLPAPFGAATGDRP